MALNNVDRLLAGYLGLLTVVIFARGPLNDANAWLLLMHVLVAILLYLFTKLREVDRVGRALHTLYPLALLLPLYAEIGLINTPLGVEEVLTNDVLIQAWEEAIFGSQVSYSWIRESPSVFWSGLFHLAYFAYYPIVTVAPVLLVLRGRHADARLVIFATLSAFIVCYVAFVVYPVGGPYYAFEHPTGPVRDVWSARLVYAVLARGSSVGAAFPSSHVAATVAATVTLWRVWRPVALTFTAPAILLTVGTVYCQMHYGVDATAGVVAGFAATLAAMKLTTNGNEADAS